MTTSQQLSSLLEQSGMPNREWWGQVWSAYRNISQMLTEDVNVAVHSNRASRPMISIFPTGNFACQLSSRKEPLRCVAFGTIRSDLFVEVVWQNITGAQDKGSTVRAYEVSERQILLEVSGFTFGLHYIESPELIRSYPSITDVPRAVQGTLQNEADENVEVLRDLKIIRDHIEKNTTFTQLYYSLRAWMVSSGLYNHDGSYQLMTLSRKCFACFDGDLLRELSWSIFLNSENGDSSENVPTMISAFLLCHESCLDSLGKDDCPFYHDSKGPFACAWSDSQFRTVHEEFRSLYSILRGLNGERELDQLNDDGLHDALQLLYSKPISQKLLYPFYVRVTMQYSGQSQIVGTKMMHFVEDRIPDLASAIEVLGEDVHLRPWPTTVVDSQANATDNPYEGYWLIGISASETVYRQLKITLDGWNDKICTSHRFSSSTMVIRAELVTREAMLQQELKEDPREWPLPLAKPDPRYVIDRIVRGVPETTKPTPTNESQPSLKLRPAMDVLSRLKHDPTFDLDDYVVGYIDRHSGMQEKAAGMWIGESTDEEWIPQGRIQYFKRVSDGKRVWDRATKYDCVFR